MTLKLWFTAIAFLFYSCCFSQPKGNLFMIGGGNRSPGLIKSLVSVAHLSPQDYIVVLPMATEQPDSAYYYIKAELKTACNNTIANLNFTLKDTANRKWLDSVLHARLIYITGGDQSRFMRIVLRTTIQKAILQAYSNGATVAGTSAGAAVMTSHMITGNHLRGDTSYSATFSELRKDNVEIQEGLGLLTTAIVDQHFVTRSRYNRLLSALAKYPRLRCIGIDESTAIIVHGKNIKVTGERQVVVFSDPKNVRIAPTGYIKFDDLRMSIFMDGDHFRLN
jgi:cyanophycinase